MHTHFWSSVRVKWCHFLGLKKKVSNGVCVCACVCMSDYANISWTLAERWKLQQHLWPKVLANRNLMSRYVRTLTAASTVLHLTGNQQKSQWLGHQWREKGTEDGQAERCSFWADVCSEKKQELDDQHKRLKWVSWEALSLRLPLLVKRSLLSRFRHLVRMAPSYLPGEVFWACAPEGAPQADCGEFISPIEPWNALCSQRKEG